MSNSTRRPDRALATTPGLIVSEPTAAGLRWLLALAYPLLAHMAGARHDPALAAIALADLALVVLLQALLQRRIGAWLLLAAIAPLLFILAHSHYALLPLLLVPVALLGLVAWTFGRTLRAGRVALITQIVAALDALPPTQLAPDLRSYTRNLTAAWAGLLGALAMANLGLALLAVPNGLLASVGITPPLSVGEAQWSWFANVLNWGIVGGFFVGEYLVRKRRFPGRYHSLLDFLHASHLAPPAFDSLAEFQASEEKLGIATAPLNNAPSTALTGEPVAPLIRSVVHTNRNS